MTAPCSNLAEAEQCSSDDDPTMPALEDCLSLSEDEESIMGSCTLRAAGEEQGSDYTAWEEELSKFSPDGHLNMFNFDEGGFLVERTRREHDVESM